MEQARQPDADLTGPRHARTEKQLAMIQEGLDDIEAGRVVDAAEVEAWLDALDRGESRPVPQSSSPS